MSTMYEVVYDAEERGLFCPSFQDALNNAWRGMEIWTLADDEPRTRMMCVWPEEAARRHGQLQDEPAPDPVPLEARRIARIAAELVNEYPHDSYAQVVALVAYAYAKGNRDGYMEAAEQADAVLRSIREAVQS